jgi:hypothetical protein
VEFRFVPIAATEARAVVAWNQRAIHAYARAGFHQTHAFVRSDPGSSDGASHWVQLTRDDREVHLVCTRETFTPVAESYLPLVRWLGRDDYPIALEAWRQRRTALTREHWDVSWPAAGYSFAGVVASGQLLSVAAVLRWQPPSPTSWELAAV